MFKRINVLKGIGRFSALNTTRGSEGDFSKLNVIYASNASGKSTLCDVLRSLDSGNPAYVVGRKRLGSDIQPEIAVLLENGQTVRFQGAQWNGRDDCPPIHVYDDRFVAENVFIGHQISVDQRRNLYGLVIGDQAITLKQAVDTAEQQLSNATTALNTSRTNLTGLIPTGYSIDSFRNIAAVEDVDNKIAEATGALRTAEHTKAKADAIQARSLLDALPIAEVPELDSVLNATLDSAALAAEAKIREHLAATSQGLPISWIKQGFDSQTSTACPHCGQDMQGLEILEAYRSFFSGELQEQERLRDATKTIVGSAFGEAAQNQLRQILASHGTERDWWRDAANYEFALPRIGDITSVLDTLQGAYRAISSVLERKQANPTNIIRLSDKESAAITAWREKTAELGTYNQALDAINAELQDRQTNAGVIDLTPLEQRLSNLNASKKRHEQGTVDAYAAYDAANSQKTTAQQQKQQANDALREQTNQQFQRYGDRINELLSLFGADFRIVSEGVTFRGGSPSGQLAIELCGTRVSSTPEAASDPSQVSLANTLSGGDRSALALAYFLAKVEMAANVDQSIVVFDDPYHNQDRSRRQCTIERIHHLTGLANQCFVFSHDLEFARAIEKRPGTPAKTFVLNPLIDQATLEAQSLPPLPSQAYLKNYHLLHNYSENPADHLQHLKEVADTLRITLEEYLRLKFPKEWAANDWLGDMIRKMREAQAGTPLSLCQPLVEELGHINTYSQRFHHGGTGEVADEPDARELKTYVDRTLKVIHAGGYI